MLNTALLLSLLSTCAPDVHPLTMQALIKTESGANQYAIGVVNGKLSRQPTTKLEAIATVRELEKQGFNYSMGLSQINKMNLPAQQLNNSTVFSACENLKAGSNILTSCFLSASKVFNEIQDAVNAALSCYYSGNFKRGFIVEKEIDNKSYVQRVIDNSKSITITHNKGGKYIVPMIDNGANKEIEEIDISKLEKIPEKEVEEIEPELSKETQDQNKTKWIVSQSKDSGWDIFGEFNDGDKNE